MKIVEKEIVVMFISDFVVYQNGFVDQIEMISMNFVNLLRNIVHSKMYQLGKSNNNDEI
jgi:hypothetical protein